jgi:hypothetical protein
VLFGIKPSTTAEQLSDFFVDHGLDITPEHIEIRDEHTDACMVSVPNPTVCALLRWAIDGDTLNGRVPMPRPRNRPSHRSEGL